MFLHSSRHYCTLLYTCSKVILKKTKKIGEKSQDFTQLSFEIRPQSPGIFVWWDTWHTRALSHQVSSDDLQRLRVIAPPIPQRADLKLCVDVQLSIAQGIQEIVGTNLVANLRENKWCKKKNIVVYSFVLSTRNQRVVG